MRSMCLAILAIVAAPAAAQTGARPNVLILLADDLGVDSLAAYAEGTDFPITPNIDALAQNGVLFRNVWSYPVCSPTRATLQTGRYGFRTGAGFIYIERQLPLSEVTLPEMLDGGSSDYSHAAFGKWHLGSVVYAPNIQGYSHFDGALAGKFKEPYSYYMWPRVVNGVESVSTTYATTAEVDAALAWINETAGPWLCFLSFHAPHTPFHAPPAGLYYEDLTGLNPSEQPRPFFKAMVEAMDTEIGRLLAGIPPAVFADTLVLFMGDNGTSSFVVQPPFLPHRAKGTIWEGGVNVPLIVSGAGVVNPGREEQAIVTTVDIFGTVARLAGIRLPGSHIAGVEGARRLDSVSIVPYLRHPGQAPLRRYAFAEIFQPNGVKGPNIENPIRATRDERYKWITAAQFGFEGLFDLVNDPFELNNLLNGTLTPEEQAAYERIQAAQADLLASF